MSELLFLASMLTLAIAPGVSTIIFAMFVVSTFFKK